MSQQPPVPTKVPFGISVRQYYGKDSEKLIEFGLQPFRGRTRTPKPTPPPTGPEAPAPLPSISAPDTTK
jgi:hypothetical protein